MPSFTYTGDGELYYPAIGVTAVPGLVTDLDAAPTDGRWVPTPVTKPTTSTSKGA